MSYADRGTYIASHYSLRHRVVARVSRSLDGVTYTVRRGLLKGLRRRGGLAFVPSWLWRDAPKPEEHFLAALQLRGQTVYDVGGFHGLMTLFFATRAAHVVVYEPNAESRTRIEENVRLNGLTNVTIRPVGLGVERQELDLVFDPRMPGGASADPAISAQIGAGERRRITVLPLDTELETERLPLPDFIKIDVEGMELGVLRGMRSVLRTHHPALYIEMHGPDMAAKQANARAVLTELADAGYTSVLHVESGATVVDDVIAAQGHLYAR